MRILEDKKHRYISYYEAKTGIGARSNVYDTEGNETDIEPFMGSLPDLLDIGIMGHCAHGLSGLCALSGVQCYQDGGHRIEDHLSFEDFKHIIDQAKGHVFQVALGGRGDPDMHPEIIKMLHYCDHHGITPNFTTSGYGLKEELLTIIKQYCGAVAVSWYRHDITLRTIQRLLDFGIKTNIHYVLSNSSIDEAIKRLSNDGFPQGINRIIFLMHKPIGQGVMNEVLQYDDPRVQKFFSLIDQKGIADKTGFDSCGVPGLVRYTSNLHDASIEACEAGRFSAYVSNDNKFFPCSFEKDPAFAVSLKDHSLLEAWNSPAFNHFRSKHTTQCKTCPQHHRCGACPIVPEISLCPEKQRKGVPYENQSRSCDQFIL